VETDARAAAFGTLLVFVTAAVMGFTFLGLTQENAARYPMGKKRAAWYTLAAGLISFGAALFPLVYFAVSMDALRTFFGAAELPGLMPALAAQIPFLIPGAALLAFLCLTEEKSRLKPWAMTRYREELRIHEKFFTDPAQAARFGLFSGAVWICAAGFFIALGFMVGFQFSWLVFVFALAAQLLLQGFLSREPEKTGGGNGETALAEGTESRV
jgi:hypothetical protein